MKNKEFTLIELLVVIMIISLTGVMVYQSLIAQDKFKESSSYKCNIIRSAK